MNTAQGGHDSGGSVFLDGNLDSRVLSPVRDGFDLGSRLFVEVALATLAADPGGDVGSVLEMGGAGGGVREGSR